MPLAHRIAQLVRRTGGAVIALLAGISVAAAQAERPAVIAGRVFDEADRPMPGVAVIFDDFELETRTARDGTFALNIDFVPSGTLTFRLIGYAPARTTVRLARGDTVRLVAHMAQLGVDVLDTIRTIEKKPVSARLVDFERRRSIGRGVFVTRDEIERKMSISVADVLRGTGAVRIVDSNGVMLATSVRGGTWNSRRQSFDPNCVMRIVLDGMLMPVGFSPGELPATKEIAGIEIYKGAATLPAEFVHGREGNNCGMIMVWTR